MSPYDVIMRVQWDALDLDMHRRLAWVPKPCYGTRFIGHPAASTDFALQL